MYRINSKKKYTIILIVLLILPIFLIIHIAESDGNMGSGVLVQTDSANVTMGIDVPFTQWIVGADVILVNTTTWGLYPDAGTALITLYKFGNNGEINFTASNVLETTYNWTNTNQVGPYVSEVYGNLTRVYSVGFQSGARFEFLISGNGTVSCGVHTHTFGTPAGVKVNGTSISYTYDSVTKIVNFSVSIASSRSVILTWSYVLGYPFDDEQLGSIAIDRSPGGNNGTIYGATRTYSGLYGKALVFDGINDYVNSTNDASLDVTDSVTIMAWIYPNSIVQNSTIIAKGNQYSIGINDTSDHLVFEWYNGGWRRAVSSSNITAGQWTFVVGAWNGSHAYVYINTTSEGTYDGTLNPIVSNSQNVSIGSYTGVSGFWNGTIDEITISNSTISQSAISALMLGTMIDYPYNENVTITNMNAGDWVFAGEKYYYWESIFIKQNTSSMYNLTAGSVRYNNSGITVTMSYAEVGDSWSMSSTLASLGASTTSYSGNSIYVTFFVYFTGLSYDEKDLDIAMYCSDSGSTDNWEIKQTDYFNIYNLGKIMDYVYVGDGGKVSGGSGFELTAATIGSSSAVNMTVRKLQHVHILFSIDTGSATSNNNLTVPSSYSQSGAVEVYFWYYNENDNSWIKMMKAIIDIQDGDVGTHGAGDDKSWVRLRIRWYDNNETLPIKIDYIVTYHQGYDRDRFPSEIPRMPIWIDFWVDRMNASTIVAGRISPFYYGMFEEGTSWWFGYGEFHPLIGNLSVSMFYTNIKSIAGSSVSALDLDLIKFGMNLSKSGENYEWGLKDFVIFEDKRVLPARLSMEGTETPSSEFFLPIDPTKGGVQFAGGITGWLSRLGDIIRKSTSSGATFIIAGIDSLLASFGMPAGIISNFITAFTVFVGQVELWFTWYLGRASDMITVIGQVYGWVTMFMGTVLDIILWFSTNTLSLFIFPIQLFTAFFTGGEFTLPYTDIVASFVSIGPLTGAILTILPMFTLIFFFQWFIQDGIFAMPGKVISIFSTSRLFFESFFWIFNYVWGLLKEMFYFIRGLG